MTNPVKKSVLCDLVSRHSNFDFNEHIANTAPEDYDIWNDFCLPMHYSDAALEYKTLRSSCAMFDASPMKKYRMRGTDSGHFLDRILTAPVSQLSVLKAAYGLICNEQGYLIDDGIVIKLGADDYLLLISELDLDDHFAKYNDFEDLAITDETALSAGIAIQGPMSGKVMQQVGFTGIEQLAPFELKYFDLNGHQILVGRLGFTGDLGYEIWFSPKAIETITNAIEKAEQTLDIKIPGYGLTALNICRIEAGMIVPGWDTAGTFEDLAGERTPYELTLGWNVKLKGNDDFVGKVSLSKEKVCGSRFKMKGIKIKKNCLLEDGHQLYGAVDGVKIEIGSLPSIVWHENAGYWIGFASIVTDCADIENIYVICNKTGNEVAGEICQIPFVDLPQRNQVPAK
ncbi:aminomethyltransferase family protein [Thalassotalea psychrophila]|uniref:Aminomethyltransferase family protein n=1 Tax=Thalassotalea psychrophila TaxID=3065647 RepID=A0ABY9TUH7_9GAMM|nr:aminomethyltransferase family protein [Colwelliaceae bacterium SQ149]